ncbi:hypothetical protein Hdeb2414_s0007g00237101 [Helianthus debilis subsp. tardiflorus]
MRRSLGSRRCQHTAVGDHEDDEMAKGTFDKHAKVEVSFYLDGFEASELKTLLPLVHQHLRAAGARQAVLNHLEALGSGCEEAMIGYDANVTLEGYENSEVETLDAACAAHIFAPVERPKNVHLLVDEVTVKRRSTFSVLSPAPF